MKILVLGVGSAIPTTKRNPSAQLLDVDGSLYLIDCGEGTQIRLRENKIRIQNIKGIFISHMHGDHYLGLMGLLWTMNLLGRKTDLYLFAPGDLQKLINTHVKVSGGRFSFQLKFIATDEADNNELYSDKKVIVSKIPLDHKIYCTGFLFKEIAKPLKLRPDKLKELDIPIKFRNSIKEGEDFTDPVTKIKYLNSELTFPPIPPRSYAYCSDTKYNKDLIGWIENVNFLYHESTFLEDNRDKAKEKMHSTAKDAALIAKDAKVGKLLLGHYSNRYKDLDLFLKEAKPYFSQVFLGEEGNWYEV